MSWLYSQALVAEFLEENSWDGEPFAQLNVMPTQHKFWRNDKTMEFSNLSQFGLTCAVLTEKHGEELLTWYLEAFHVKTLAQQEKAQESKAKEAECGKKWRGLLAKYDPSTHSWKTAQCSLLEDLELSLQSWPRWGSMRNGACYLQQKLGINISEKESGFLLPTVTKQLMSYWSSAKQKLNNNGLRESGCKIGSIFWWTMTMEHIQLGGKEESQLIPDPLCGESLMGWPLGWTGLQPLETDKIQEWLQQHLSCLESDLEDATMQRIPLDPNEQKEVLDDMAKEHKRQHYQPKVLHG
jgi:hypothetical protein